MTTQVYRIDELARLRNVVGSALTVALWLHVPLIAGVAWFHGNAAFVLGGSAFLAAASATGIFFSWSAGTARRIAKGVALIVMVSLLVGASAGGAWQTDIHMYYFAALALLATYCDRNVIIGAATVTAVHHLVLSFAAPALVFPGDSELGRVFLHAGILVIEAGALIWLTSDLDRVISKNAANLMAADAAKIQIENAVAAQAEAQRQSAETRHKTMVELSDRFEANIGSIVENVAAAATELQSTSEAMATTAQHTTGQSMAAAASSDRATRHVQDVGTATETLTVLVAEISQKITRTTIMIKDSVTQAVLSNEQVRGLTEAADKIGDVVGIISNIAGQTNLLALNATIEAARAGDAGKGFAVVASEVKALATQTAKATNEIAAQVKAIQEATQSSAQLIQATTNTIRLVDETTATIAAAVEQQGAATLDIAHGVRHAAEGTQEVSGGISGVNEAARQTGEAATEVLSAAGELSRNGETLKAEVDRFLREVRAA